MLRSGNASTSSRHTIIQVLNNPPGFKHIRKIQTIKVSNLGRLKGLLQTAKQGSHDDMKTCEGVSKLVFSSLVSLSTYGVRNLREEAHHITALKKSLERGKTW